VEIRNLQEHMPNGRRSADKRGVRGAKTPSNRLPKAVLDRIHRYAKEGREPLARYEPDGCLLLAIASGQLPVVVLRSTREDFTEIRSAALVEWLRVAQLKTSPRRAGRT
jgi:hypothetical protein